MDCENFLVSTRTHFKAIDAHRATVVGLAGGVGEDSQLIIRGPRLWHGVQAEQTSVVCGLCILPSAVGPHDSMRDTRLPHVMETCESRVVRAQESLCWGVSRSVTVEICQVSETPQFWS